MKDDGDAEFELEMSLKDPTSKIFIFKVRCFILSVYFFLNVEINETKALIFILHTVFCNRQIHRHATYCFMTAYV